MFNLEPQTVADVALAGLGLAGVVGIWAVRQEGRINAHDQLFEEREKQAVERHTDLKNDLKELKEMLKAGKR